MDTTHQGFYDHTSPLDILLGTPNTEMYTPKPNRTAPAPDTSDVGRTSHCYELEEDRQEINEPTCCANETSQLLLEEKQAIARREEDLKSGTEHGIIALNVFAPIKRLSDDVLCHIFELHCKDSLPVSLPLNHQVCVPAPPQITLSHVCSAWREIMLDVPTFWSSIRIVPRNLNTPQTIDTVPTVVKVANTWLSRAKGLPCSIDIDFPEDNEVWDSHRSLWEKDWHENIIRDLISLHKFKKLGVTFADHHLRDLLQLADDKLSCVEDLCLRYISLSEDDTTSPLDLHKLCNLTSFSLLPNPFYLYSLSDPAEGYDKFAGIPWHNLRHVHLHVTIPALFCLDLLEHCSVLETSSLVITGDLSFTSSPRVPVHLFQLRKLEVVVYSLSIDEEILKFFLLSLRFPNLKSLTLGSSEYPVILEMLLRVQNASQMQLEELIIPESTLDIDVRNLLTGFPSLRRLELPGEVMFTDEAMIEVGEGSIGIFLEDLTINDPGLDLEKLLQMVKVRSCASERDGKHGIEVTEFKSITLHCDEVEDEMEDEVLYFIKEIKRLGVDLNVVFAEYPDEEPEQDGLNGDYSDASCDDEAIYGDFQWHIDY